MDMKKKINKDGLPGIITVCLAIGCYIAERMVEVFVRPSPTQIVLLMLVFTACSAFACFLISRTKNVFYALLASMVSFKMLPPAILSISKVSYSINTAYGIIQNLCVIAFLLMGYFILKKQTKPDRISAVPLLVCISIVPFFLKISYNVSGLLMSVIKSTMLFEYASEFAFYFLATVVILLIAYHSNRETMHLVAVFEYIALGVNIMKRCGAIATNILDGTHISKSLFVWIAVYAVCIALVIIADKKAKQNNVEEFVL